MFTGIVEELGRFAGRDGSRFRFEASVVTEDAAIGGSIGAGAGTTAVLAGDRNHATLSAGTPLTVRIEEPVVVTVEK